jgi:hypothetical protein
MFVSVHHPLSRVGGMADTATDLAAPSERGPVVKQVTMRAPDLQVTAARTLDRTPYHSLDEPARPSHLGFLPRIAPVPPL